MRIGVDLGGTKIEFIAISDNGTILGRNRVSTPKNDYRATITAIKEGIEALENVLSEKGSIGIGIPGTISPHSGLVRGANSTWLIGNPIDRDLEAALERPVRVANDANCFTLSEATDGSGAGFKLVFGVILGTGVGGGLCISGDTISGLNGITGEWGHSPLPLQETSSSKVSRKDRECYCGKFKCIETFLSGPGFARSFFDHSGQYLSPNQIVNRLHDNDQYARAAMSLYEEQLACALAGVINMVDPDIIVLGGGLSNINRLYKNVPNLWQKWCFSDRVDTPLKPPKHGDASGVRGAAWLWPLE